MSEEYEIDDYGHVYRNGERIGYIRNFSRVPTVDEIAEALERRAKARAKQREEDELYVRADMESFAQLRNALERGDSANVQNILDVRKHYGFGLPDPDPRRSERLIKLYDEMKPRLALDYSLCGKNTFPDQREIDYPFQSEQGQVAYAIKKDMSIIETTRENAMSLCQKREAVIWTDDLNRMPVGYHGKEGLKKLAKEIIRDEKYKSSSRLGKLAMALGQFAEDFFNANNHDE